MNLGSYKFLEYSKHLLLIKLCGDDFFKNIYLNPCTFEYIENNSIRSFKDFGNFYFSDITLPTIENIRKCYQLGDIVYTVTAHQFVKGKIIKKIGNAYTIEDVYEMYRTRIAHQLFPYNWHILHINCRKAIEAWLYCSRRLKIYLNLRKLISVYIWELRNEYEWDF